MLTGLGPRLPSQGFGRDLGWSILLDSIQFDTRCSDWLGRITGEKVVTVYNLRIHGFFSSQTTADKLI